MNTTNKKKRVTAQNRGVTAQFEKTLDCALGCCSHKPTSKTCIYWKKIVDADYPEKEQRKIILKLVKDELNAKI